MAVNKVIYGTTVLVDLTEDTVTPADLALGVMAHDASGAIIEGTFYLQDYLDITPTEDSQYFDPGASASRGELIENREISIEKVSGLNLNTALESALGNVAFNTAGVYFVGEIEVTCNYIVQGSTINSGTTMVYIDGASVTSERGWLAAYSTMSYSGDGDAYRIGAILAKGSSSHLTKITCTGHSTNSYYYYDISGWLDTYSAPIASGFRTVNVSAIPSEYIIPTGTKSISDNGTGIDVAQYASVDVAVPTGSTPTLQSKSVSYTPSETAQSATVTPDNGYDGLSSVNVSVGAISSTYVGSGITRRSSSDLTASGATVTVPAGYYSTQASKAVASGTAGTPTATKGTVSNHSISVTPSVTNTTGYITGGTKTGTAVTVSASELVSGSETKTANGTYDVTNLASVVVDVAQETFVVTVSKDQNDAWIPDKTYSEVAAAYNSGKTITVRCNVGAGNASADGSFANNRFVYWVRELSGDEEIETGYSYLSDSRVNVERYTYVSSSSIVTYHTSTSAPTSSQGNDGDIWLVTA